MGLKITKNIGTNYGITNEAYVRISSYNIQKNGTLSFSLELFNSKPEENPNNTLMAPQKLASNIEIGNTLNLTLTKKESRTRIVMKPVSKEVQVTETITTPSKIEGEAPIESTITKTETRSIMEEVSESYEVDVPDLSQLETTPIFEFAYGKLREKLQKLFGDKNVIDC